MKKIGIGYENYKRLIDDGCYYIDKTLLIKDIMEKGGMANLFTRPRRFGKTLALSMIRTFFELEYDRDGNVVDNRRYFEGMKIMDAGEDIVSKMGKYPVIKLSLKSAKQPNFYTAFLKLRDEIIGEYDRHRYLLDSNKLIEEQKGFFKEICAGIITWDRLSYEKQDEVFAKEVARYATALRTLSEYLRIHHDTNVILLLDEYDVPLENAYFAGFYDEMVGFIRSLFESVLKTNDTLEFAVITGCLRISKESIFTGLNHFEVNTIRSRSFGEFFGFTQEETEKMLVDYELPEKVEEVRRWYDGYLFGEEEVYNPWSVIKYVKEHTFAPDAFPEPYWSNTSSNSIIRDLVFHADAEQKRELESLLDGGVIEKRIHEDITYNDIKESEDNLWNFLYFTGYMKKVSERFDGEDIYVTMKIPNTEVKTIYRDQIMKWFDGVKKMVDREVLYEAIINKDTKGIANFVNALLKKMISTFDSGESFYHGFFLSLLYYMEDYAPRSNREEGDGRPDIVLYPENPTDPAYIFEIKTRKKFNEMQDGLEEAFTQIKDKRYEEGILDDGYAGVISFAMCFCKKSCIVEICESKNDE